MAWVQAMLAGLALVAACSNAPLKKGSDGGEPDCTGLPAPTIACLFGPTVLVCVLDQNGHPAWNVSCPGGNTGGAGGGGGAGVGGGPGGAGGSNPDGGVGQVCASSQSCPSGMTCTTEDGVCNAPPGCDPSTACPAVCYGTCRLPAVPPPITFSLQNGGATSTYIYEGCSPELTITELSTPPIVIGLPDGGCGICDCAQTTCPPVVCGPCYQGGLEIAAAGAQQYFWDPVDMSYETRGATECSHTRILPPGHYRIEIPVYTSAADAVAKTGARLVTKTFDLPTTDTIYVQLASGAP
jgi:hypothetical protein